MPGVLIYRYMLKLSRSKTLVIFSRAQLNQLQLVPVLAFYDFASKKNKILKIFNNWTMERFIRMYSEEMNRPWNFINRWALRIN